MASTPILPFAIWPEGITQARFPANDNSLRNQILNGLVLSKMTTSQPASPANGDIYIIPDGATGAQWSLMDENDLVIYQGGTWYPFAPVEGVVVNFLDSQEQFFGGSVGWDALSGGGGGSSDWGDIGGTLGNQTDLQAALDAKASLTYVDGLVQGLSWKKAVRAATTTSGTLASSFENGDAIDGVTLATNDRILIKNQSSATENGIYTVNASGAPTRAADADTGAELVNATVYVSEGTTLADTQWTQTANAPITIGSTSLSFVQLSAGGGGVTGFTSSLNTSGVNSTVNASMLLASGGTTNQHAVFSPKGTGGVVAQLPDSSTTGGNSRGANCVDWQTSRSAATQVAQSLYSTVAGGAENTSSNNYATVGGGRANLASGDYSAIPGGWANTCSGLYSGVTNGRDNVASGQQSRVGGSGGNARGIMGADIFGLVGGNQRGAYGLQRNTVNTATQATATVDYNGTPSAANQIVLANNMAMTFSGYVVAKQSGSTDAKHWEFKGGIVRGANAGTTTLTAAVTPTVIAAAAGAAAWAVDIDADTTLGCLRIKVTGEAAKNINWTVVVEPTAEVVI